MSESGLSAPRFVPARLFAALAGLLLLAGCASAPRQPEDLSPILPVSESRLETAPPAARDALDEGLRWIAEDAPRTKVLAASPGHPSP